MTNSSRSHFEDDHVLPYTYFGPMPPLNCGGIQSFDGLVTIPHKEYQQLLDLAAKNSLLMNFLKRIEDQVGFHII